MGKSALLLMDLQLGILGHFPDPLAYLKSVSQAADAARAASIPVIYITSSFRPGHPDTSTRNMIFAHVAAMNGFIEGSQSVQIHPDVFPTENDIVVTKRRVSAFSGSDLDVILRSLDIETLVITGLATSGVVLSTLRYAADLDYRITVLEDLCMDPDAEVHRVLMEKVFPRQAEVLKSDGWISAISGRDD